MAVSDQCQISLEVQCSVPMLTLRSCSLQCASTEPVLDQFLRPWADQDEKSTAACTLVDGKIL